MTPLHSQQKSYEKTVFVYKKIEGHEIKANIFSPDTGQKHPVLVYFHGGGFIFGNRDHGLQDVLLDKLLEHNYAVVSADYRLAPETKLDEIMKDAKEVIKWIKLNGSERFNIDTSRIAASGGSSGGYLAYATGFDPNFSPDAVIAVSTPTGFLQTNIQMGDLSLLNQPGPYDIVKDTIVSYGDYDMRMRLWRFLARNQLALYEIFGFDPSKEPEKLDSFTLSNNIKSDYPPTLIIHAKNDPLVDLAQVEAFYRFLQDKKIDSEMYLVEYGHSSELINQNPDAVDKIIDFLNKKMKE